MANASTTNRYERGLKKMGEVYGVDTGEFVAAINALNLLHETLAEKP
jgi:hypothetical protein